MSLDTARMSACAKTALRLLAAEPISDLRDRYAKFSGEDFAKNLEHLIVHRPIVGQNVRSAEIRRAALHVGDAPARFLDQQQTRRHVPRFQSELPERVEAPASHVGQIEGGGPGTPHTVGCHRELVIEVNVHVQMALVARKPGCNEALVELGHLGYTNTAVVEKSPTASLGCEHLLPQWIENDARDDRSGALQPERNIEHRKAMRKVRGSVQGIHIPAVLWRSLM